MKVICHRGLWKNRDQQNTLIAFEKAFKSGFGVEVDVRDNNSKIIISHGIPRVTDNVELSDVFKLYNTYNKQQLCIAINIKADGLAGEIGMILNKYDINNYFTFDMSIPDELIYLDHGINVFTRHSEYELKPSFYDMADGIWMDQFHRHWINEAVIKEHIEKKKKVCIVSPELHGRDFSLEWNDYKQFGNVFRGDQLMICTDYPYRAKEFFK